MRQVDFIDVFGDGGPSGNPVAVVHNADGLSDEDLQRFASWTNLSETTFLFPPTIAGADYRVRIFTATRELPFAGHPTLGSAQAWLSAQDRPDGQRAVQQCAAGLIEVQRVSGQLAFAAPPLTRSGPLDPGTLKQILDAFELGSDEVIDQAWMVNGPDWATVRLPSIARLLELTPSPQAPHNVGLVAIDSNGQPELRAFVAVGSSAFEDPVTGSLNAGVAQWLTANGVLRVPYLARQGTALGRRGRILVTTGSDGVIWVGGRTLALVTGTVTLESTPQL